MGRIVIVAYKPKPGRDAALGAVVAKHIAVLRSESLVTDRPAVVMKAADGTVVEVFEWRSAEAIDRAHRSAAVQALWAEFGAACDYVPLAQVPEARQVFAEFEAVDAQGTGRTT